MLGLFVCRDDTSSFRALIRSECYDPPHLKCIQNLLQILAVAEVLHWIYTWKIVIGSEWYAGTDLGQGLVAGLVMVNSVNISIGFVESTDSIIHHVDKRTDTLRFVGSLSQSRYTIY